MKKNLKKIATVEDDSIICLKSWNGERKLLRMGKTQEILAFTIKEEKLRVIELSEKTPLYKKLLGKRVGDFVSNKSSYAEHSFRNAQIEIIYLFQ